MSKRISSPLFIGLSVLLATAGGCAKGSLEINSTNPNLPSSVSPEYVLSAALTTSAYNQFYYSTLPADYYMGYWANDAAIGISSSELDYQTNTSEYTGNWDAQYLNMVNYRLIETESTDSLSANYEAIAKIMLAYHFAMLVDLYNNVPYLDALQGGTVDYPAYTGGSAIYTSCIHQLDSAITLINTAPATANNPQNYDVMFKGNMQSWVLFANTVKLRLLLNLTETATGPTLIQSELNGLTTGSFLGAGQDATINPGYSNSSSAQQSPFWQYFGYNTAGAPNEFNTIERACTYAVTFYQATNDPRDSFFYAPNDDSVIRGRAFGSQNTGEQNNIISGLGKGVLQSPEQPAFFFPAFESLFLQAEAAERGYISADPAALFQSAVSESFRLLGVPNYATAAAAYTAQNDARVNYTASSNKLQTIILQKWAALNSIDPVESWNDWRRLGIPTNIPISVFDGTVAPHIPYRILYPQSEYQYNTTNVDAQGTISNITSKIFWMP